MRLTARPRKLRIDLGLGTTFVAFGLRLPCAWRSDNLMGLYSSFYQTKSGSVGTVERTVSQARVGIAKDDWSDCRAANKSCIRHSYFRCPQHLLPMINQVQKIPRR